jgi:hypothetical protein
VLWRENPVKIGSNCTSVYFLLKKKVGTSCSPITTFGHLLSYEKMSLKGEKPGFSCFLPVLACYGEKT